MSSDKNPPAISADKVNVVSKIADTVSTKVNEAILEAVEKLPFGSEERRALHRVLAGLFSYYAGLEGMQDGLCLDDVIEIMSVLWGSIEDKLGAERFKGHA